MKETEGIRVVQAGGSVTIKGYRFYHPRLTALIGEPVMVKWSQGNIIPEVVDVYEGNSFVCRAGRPHLMNIHKRNGHTGRGTRPA